MSKKVFVTRPIPEIGLNMLREKGYEVDVGGWQEPPTKQDILSALTGSQFDAVLTLLTDPIDAEVMDAAPSVKIYANYAVGFNNFDIDAAKQRGIAITNTPGNFSYCIAEHAMALILALTTRLVEGDRYIREGKYKGWDPMALTGTDLKGKKLGLLGVGHIGSEIAHIAMRGFGLEVIYNDIVRSDALEKEGAEYRETTDDVVREADIISLHVPLLDSTRHLINAERLAMMKPTAFLINTSRGPVVDENALVAALRNGMLRGAGLDVFEFEPRLADGLAELQNVVLTPHIASARESARNEMAVLAAQNIIDFFETGEPKNKVN